MPTDQNDQPDRNPKTKIAAVSITDVRPDSIASRPAETGGGGLAAAPDGGWGWVVVTASFTAHLIADGCSLSFGVLFTELLEAFEESKSKTAWVGSLFISMPLICGPFASMIVNRYGCRTATMTGGVLAAVGCISSAFVNSIDMLCLTFGVLSGFGLSLVFIPAVLVVAFYFNQKRSLATGIAVAGTGIGTFIFAPLTELLIEEYSWRGALLIIGGVMLNFVVCGAIFRPLREAPESLNTTVSDSRFSEVAIPIRISSPSSCRSLEEVDDAFDNDPFSNPNDLRLAPVLQISRPLSQSLILFPTYLNGYDYVSESELVQLIKTRGNRLLSEGHDHPENVVDLLGTGPANQVVSCDSGVTILDNNSSYREDHISMVLVEGVGKEKMCVYGVVPKSSVLTNGSLNCQANRLLQLHRNQVFCRRGLLQARFFLARGHMSSCPDIYLSSVEGRPGYGRLQKLLFSSRAVIYMLKNTFDLSIFKSAIFNYFCLHSMLLYMSYNNPYIYLPDKAVEHGISDDSASTLVAIIGITSTVGQIVMGFIGDRPKVDTIFFYSAMTSIAGLVTLFVPLFTTFSLLASYSAMYGFFISANYALTSIILVDILGLEQLTNSFGVVSSAGGLAVLFGPPFAGWISDQTGSYESTFYISGIVILVSGCMLFFVPCLRHKICCSKSSGKIPPCKIVVSKSVSLNDSFQLGTVL